MTITLWIVGGRELAVNVEYLADVLGKFRHIGDRCR